MITLTGGTESLETELTEYLAAWHKFKMEHMLTEADFDPIATTISWKVAEKATLFENLYQIGDAVEQTHVGTVNGRFIASSVLHAPYQGMRLLKIMERRSGSSDRLGLDGLDFYVSDMGQVKTLLQKTGSAVQAEQYDMHRWLSLRFGSENQYEAKFVDHLVLRVAIEELEVTQADLLKQILKQVA